MTANLNEYYSAREEIIQKVQEDLLGPADGTALDVKPLDRIIAGVLFPQKGQGRNEGPISDRYDHPIADKTGSEDSAVEDFMANSSKALRPSSIGLTFALSSDQLPQELHVDVSATRYINESAGTWVPQRVATVNPIVVPIPKDKKASSSWKDAVQAGEEGLEVRALFRPVVDGRLRVTISLVNTFRASEGKYQDAYCWFRPELSISTPLGCFVDGRPEHVRISKAEDVRASEFLYRDSLTLAIGHGCAASWDKEDRSRISSTFFPTQEVLLANPTGGEPTEDNHFGAYSLSMEDFAKGTNFGEMRKLVEAYRKWIQYKRVELENEGLGRDHKLTGEQNLAEAARCADRIEAGIDALENQDVRRAFVLMNQAMVQQRNAQDSARAQGSTKQREQKWRPFQLAFILMNLPALSDAKHRDRDSVDLLWFPTGGGKTEAYLGCIAFAILFRRIKKPNDGGVSSIMRYTLRMLTTDQFQRAAGLICALEIIRRRELPETAPISLGLWVGDSTTPNTIKGAKTALNREFDSFDSDKSTPVQITRCPSCGEAISKDDYFIDEFSNTNRLVISCPAIACEFHEGLPLYVVDEDVYACRPSLLIGTVDKFAQMAWKKEVAALLSLDGRNSRPDLIVQDELHLISGPLGTMVGLYESALDLAIGESNKTKIVASTATIRRSEEQVRNVFNRGACQFPPQGLDPSDNYFAKDASPEEKGPREYVGIIAPATSQATLLVRLYSAILQAVQELQVSDEVKDAYWTMLAYFNSLRVLGAAYLQTVDDVPARVENIASRHGVPARNIRGIEPLELTSRVPSSQIPRDRERMELQYPDPESPSVVLATNMISVGLDIDRLGLMVVAGQPQNASEYIQATSRVGRKHPGLVFVAFNAQRARDVSHFENFVPFHRSLYRAVEATTATPFAARARDRGAHGVLVSAIRLMIEDLRTDAGVSEVEAYSDEIQSRIIEPLVERAREVSPEDANAFARQLEQLLEEWKQSPELTEYGKMMSFRAKSRNESNSLMRAAGESGYPSQFDPTNIPWPTLTSLRDVDVETQLVERFARKRNREDNNG